MEAARRKQLRVLILKALERGLNDDQTEQLETLLRHDPEARQYYFDLIDIAKALRDVSDIAGTKAGEFEDFFAVDEGMLRALAEVERNAPTLCQMEPMERTQEVRPVDHKAAGQIGKGGRFWFRIVKLAVAACVGLSLFVWLNPGPPMRMCLVSAVRHAVWEKPDQALSTGDAVFDQDKPRTLKSGIVKLTFAHQTEAIIEGPATFSCPLDNRVVLQAGKVCAYVPYAKSGFEVRTPNSKVLDLGTEFGVDVDSRGSLVQVFQGKVALKRPRDTSGKLITAGNARTVSSVTQAIGGGFFEPEAFVRYVNKDGSFIWHGQALDLVDVVANGDGFGNGLPDMGISVMTGFQGQYQGFDQVQHGRRQYLPVPGSRLVDGVFSVWGKGQIVSSTGLIWRGCPLTNGFFAKGVILCGACYDGSQSFHVSDPGHQGDGIQNQALSVPVNTGITFDLNAMRHTLRGVAMETFAASCGLSETFFGSQPARPWEQTHAEPCADIFVLLDGRPVLVKHDVCPSQGAVDVKVAIHSENNFLTLVVTAGRDKPFLEDWAIFNTPRIRLQRQ